MQGKLLPKIAIKIKINCLIVNNSNQIVIITYKLTN